MKFCVMYLLGGYLCTHASKDSYFLGSSYFLSRPADCSKQLLKLLIIDKESTEIPRLIEMYLLFSQHVMEMVKSAVLELESNETSTADVFIILTNLKNKLKSRCDEEFFGYHVHQLLANVNAAEAQEATKDFRLFLNSAITYLEKKIDFDENSTFGKLSKLSLLDDPLPKHQIFVEIVEDVKLKDKLNLNMDDLFDEIALIQKSFGTIQSTELFKECKTTSSKWHLILKSVNLKCVNVFKIVSFVLSIPGTSAYCERIFSIIELFVYFNFKDTCREFSEKIKRDPQLLKSAKSQKKYNFKN